MNKMLKICKKVFYVFAVSIMLSLICFIAYCKIQERIYYSKGPNYEPDFSIYTISSSSMAPNYNKYDLVINKKVDIESIDIGDVITFISTNIGYLRIVTHRVNGFTVDEKNRTAFITKGDNNDVDDPSYARGDNVIGKVVMRIPLVGILSTPIGIIGLVVMVIVFVVIKKKWLKKQSY